MAKSNFEPKKIVRYAESSIPKNGISSIPTPRIQRSTSATGTGLGSGTGASDTPPPPPPPPAPIQTGSFYFDGATELTGSMNTVGGRNLYKGLVHTTLTPGWAQEDTGSFTLFSVSNPSDVADYRRYLSFRRTSGSNGYEDLIVVELSSGSYYDRSIWKNPLSPNFYSGSTDEIFFQAFFTEGWLGGWKIDAKWYGYDYLNPPVREREYLNNNIKNVVAKLDISTGDYFLTIGGQSSGSDGYFKGTISNFALTKNNGNYYSDTFPRSAETDSNTDMVYRFEGNVSASKGSVDLAVVGTETYVTGSF